MYAILTLAAGIQDPARFDFVYIGNAFFIFVGSTLFGTFQVIQADREWYQTLRYVYISPISYYTYIIGRASAKVIIATFAVIITLLFGVLFLGVQIDLTAAEVPGFLGVLVLGMFALVGIGVCLAAISFLTARHVHGLAEGVPGVFYLFCGVLFPLSILPSWGQSVGQAIPLTYWFEMIRRTLMPADRFAAVSAASPTTLEAFGLTEVVLLLAASAALFFFLSVVLFRGMEWLARRQGKLDMITHY